MLAVVEFLLSGFTDNSGQPLAGGKVYSYAAGTTTPKSLYVDNLAATPAENPVILDSNGRAQVFAAGAYKLVVKDSDDVILYTYDDLFFRYNTASTEADMLALDAAGVEIYIDSAITLTDDRTINAPIIFLPGGKIITNGNILSVQGTFWVEGGAGKQQVFETIAAEINLAQASCTEIFPEWFGAKGDGTTDDTTAVNTTITIASSIGKTVLLTESYLTADGIQLASNVIIDGGGKIKRANSSTAFALGLSGSLLSNVQIRNIEVDGNKANSTSGYGIEGAFKNLVIENCFIHDTPYSGIALTYFSGCGAETIRNNRIKNCGQSNEFGGIAVTGGVEVQISGNQITASDGQMYGGINVEPNAGTPGAVGFITITNNIILQGGLQIDCGSLNGSGQCGGFIVANNVILKAGGWNRNAYNDAAMFFQNITESLITGNIIFSDTPTPATPTDNGYLGIVLYNYNLFVTVSNNDFYMSSQAATSAAIQFWINEGAGTPPSEEINISGNRFFAFGPNALTYGVFCEDSTHGNLITARGNTAAGNVTNLYSIGDHVISSWDQPVLIGVTGSRPVQSILNVGAMYFDTTLVAAGKPIWWNGTQWVDATGTVV